MIMSIARNCGLLMLAAAAILCPLTRATCSISSGPAGSYACIKIPRYSGSQYVTCLTNDYIQRKSGGKHGCENHLATFCYYQCMLELHSVNSGSVTPDCSCDLTATPTPASESTTLPPRCYSPDGGDCSWYAECLERRFACGVDTGYALGFGKKYCELYGQNYMKFSDLGRRWVDAVRKCLQVSLVPLIRGFSNPTCDVIKTTAVSQHLGCYLAPPMGPTVCEVLDKSCMDVVTIYFTIKDAFFDVTVAFETLKSFFAPNLPEFCGTDIIFKCGMELTKTGVKNAVNVVSFKIEELRSITGRRRRSIETQPEHISMKFAAAVSEKLGWKKRGVDWMPLSVDRTTEGINLRLLLGDQRVFNLNRNYSQPLDLGQEVKDLQDRVRSGDLLLELNGGQTFYTRQVSDCEDSNCTVVRSSVSAPSRPTETRAAGSVQPVPLFLTALAVLACFHFASITQAGN